jgi:hypothetical protein
MVLLPLPASGMLLPSCRLLLRRHQQQPSQAVPPPPPPPLLLLLLLLLLSSRGSRCCLMPLRLQPGCARWWRLLWRPLEG